MKVGLAMLKMWLDRPPPPRLDPFPTEDELRALPGYSIDTALSPALDERPWEEFELERVQVAA